MTVVYVGNIFSDAADWVGDRVDDVAGAVADVAKAAWDVVDEIPGVAELGDGFEAVVTGPLRDLAKTVPGQIILRSLAGSMFALGPALATVAGPQLALAYGSVAIAAPGLARGESFWSAWFQEGWYRAKTTAQILGTEAAGQIMAEASGKMTEALQEITTMVGQNPILKSLGVPLQIPGVEELATKLGIPTSFDVEALAKRFGLDEWSAAMVRTELYPDLFPLPSRSEYDMVTGKKKKLIRTLGKRKSEPALNRYAMTVTPVVPLSSPAVARALVSAKTGKPVASPSVDVAVTSADNASPRQRALDSAGSIALVGVGTAAAIALAWAHFRKRR